MFGQYYVSFPEVSNVLINPRSAGAGANILRGVASAGVLAIYDKYVLTPLQIMKLSSNIFRRK